MELADYTTKMLEAEITRRKEYEGKLSSFWVVNHEADTNETGLPMKRTYINTVWKGFESQRTCEQEIVEDFCFKRFGEKTAYVQGVAPCPNWTVRKIKKEVFENRSPIIWGGWSTETCVIILEIGNHGKTDITYEQFYEGRRA